MRQITRFLQGMTFYPFPVYYPGAFVGWTDNCFKWCIAGALTTIVAFASGIFILIGHLQ